MAKKVITALEGILQENVKALLRAQYAGKPSRLAKKNPNVKLSRIQDVVKNGSCNVSTLGPLADAFDLKPYQLLIPSLDVDAPQRAVSAKHAKVLDDLATGGNDEADGARERGGRPAA